MEEDAYGIPKPKDTELIVPTLLFVPCVGYSAGGYRLGYGGGFSSSRTPGRAGPAPTAVGLGFADGFLRASTTPRRTTCRWTRSSTTTASSGRRPPSRAAAAWPLAQSMLSTVSGSGTSPMVSRVVMACACSQSQKALISGRSALR